MHIYTDRYNDDAIGECAAISQVRSISRKLMSASSIFTAELTAICDALVIEDKRDVVIFVDSRSAIDFIKKYNDTHPIVSEI